MKINTIIGICRPFTITAYLSSGFAWRLWAKHMKNYVTLSEATLKSAIAIPWDFAVFKNSLGSLVNSLRFPWFSKERPFPWFQSVWESWLTLAAAIASMLVMSMVLQRPRRQYMVLQWGQVDLQEYANGSLVSNNNIFTIPFLNTYYHKQMKRILIAAYNETFRQSSDPVYAHTPMRNTGELRTFNPKLKDSAGGEVNKTCIYGFSTWIIY